MTASPAFIKGLKAAAVKAAGRAAAAKTQVRAAKAQLKQARKLFKMEKRAAKRARRELDAASAIARAPRPAATLELEPAVRKGSAAKPLLAPRRSPPKTAAKSLPKKIRPRAAKARAQEAPDTMRSAAEVAKSVIERLHAPPPILPPPPIIPASPPLSSDDAAGAPDKS